MPLQAEAVRRLAETIEVPKSLRVELAHLSQQLDEPWEEVLGEALSELRTLYNVNCDDLQSIGV
ncbi:MAG: hypothetical protein AAF596_09815 [Planctomycetota bacterium]